MVTYLSLKEKFEAKVGTEDRESQRSQGLSSLILPQPEDQAHHSALGCIITYTHPTPSLTPALFMASAPHNSLVSRQQHKGKVERGAREAQMELAVTQSNPVPGGAGGRHGYQRRPPSKEWGERAEVRKYGSNHNRLDQSRNWRRKMDITDPRENREAQRKACPKGNREGRQETGGKRKMSCPP